MSTVPQTEKEIRIAILEQALRLSAGQTANYFHEPESSVARELVGEGLVTGSASRSGGAGVTGIRDSGRDYLKAQRPLHKIQRISARVLIAISSGIVAAVAYILSLDSVKKFISDFFGRFLK